MNNYQLTVSLLNLQKEYNFILEKLSEGIELTDDQDFEDEKEKEERINQTFQDMATKLMKIEQEQEDKIVSISRIYKDLKKHKEQIEEYKKRLANRINTINRDMDFFKNFLFGFMESIGLRKVKDLETGINTYIRKNGQKVEVIDPDKIPEEYKKIDISIQINEIKKKLKQQEEVAGAVLVDGKESLTIS